MSSGSFKNVINKMETKPIYLLINHVYLYSYKQNLAINDLPRLKYHKTQQTKPSNVIIFLSNAFKVLPTN